MSTSVYGKEVCCKCAGTSLGRYIKKHGENGTCDYCGGETNPTMQIEQILPKMYKSWELYFSNYEDSSFSEEFRTEYLIGDIVEEEEVELTDANEDFLSDLKKLPEDKVWQKDSEYWTPYPEALKSSWERFSTIIKSKWRYTYFLCGNDELDPATYSPFETMQNIFEIINLCNELIFKLAVNTSIFRTRKDQKQFDLNAKGMGSAPSKYAKSNRFSPKGISMFYGSLDSKTCMKEASGDGMYSHTAEFQNSRELRLLDLTNIPPIPKLYDENFGFIPALKFLHYFSSAISEDGKNNEMNYIPTQAFTEFIRLQGRRKLNIKGIKYCSAKQEDGINIVLFYENAECKDTDDGTDCLILKSIVDD